MPPKKSPGEVSSQVLEPFCMKSASFCLSKPGTVLLCTSGSSPDQCQKQNCRTFTFQRNLCAALVLFVLSLSRSVVSHRGDLVPLFVLIKIHHFRALNPQMKFCVLFHYSVLMGCSNVFPDLLPFGLQCQTQGLLSNKA